MICERCGADMYRYNTCDYCKRKICINCVKSSRRLSKTVRIVICKDDWTKMSSRKIYKSATLES